MNISGNKPYFSISASYVNATYTEKFNKILSDKESELQARSEQFSVTAFSLQIEIAQSDTQKADEAFRAFLKEIGYDGKPIAELSQEEAADLVSEEGFFGIEQTAKRIADFVIQGSGGDEALMREGRKGILQGFEEAESIWGSTLPDISYKTIEKAVEQIDMIMHELGYAILKEDV